MSFLWKKKLLVRLLVLHPIDTVIIRALVCNWLGSAFTMANLCSVQNSYSGGAPRDLYGNSAPRTPTASIDCRGGLEDCQPHYTHRKYGTGLRQPFLVPIWDIFPDARLRWTPHLVSCVGPPTLINRQRWIRIRDRLDPRGIYIT